jgi:hypothetical protein
VTADGPTASTAPTRSRLLTSIFPVISPLPPLGPIHIGRALVDKRRLRSVPDFRIGQCLVGRTSTYCSTTVWSRTVPDTIQGGGEFWRSQPNWPHVANHLKAMMSVGCSGAAMILTGRRAECRVLDELVKTVRDGRSRAPSYPVRPASARRRCSSVWPRRRRGAGSPARWACSRRWSWHSSVSSVLCAAA